MKKISGTMICILSACVIVVFYLFFNIKYNSGKDDSDKDNASNIEMDLSKIEIANVENSLGQFDIKDMDTSSTDKICEYIEDIPEELLDLFLERKTNTSDNPYEQYIVSPNVQDEELISQFYEIIKDNGKGYSINDIESLTQIDMDGDGEDEYVVLGYQYGTSVAAFAFVLKQINNKWIIVGGEYGGPSSLCLIEYENRYYIVNGYYIGFLEKGAAECKETEVEAQGQVNKAKFWHSYSLCVDNTIYSSQELIYKKDKLLPDYIGDNRYNLENLTEKKIRTTEDINIEVCDYQYSTDTLYMDSENGMMYGFLSIKQNGEYLTHNVLMIILKQIDNNQYEIIQINYMKAQEEQSFEEVIFE